MSESGGASGKESIASAGGKEMGVRLPRLERSPGGRARQPTLVFLTGESPGQRSLVGYGWHRVRHDCSDLAHMRV